MHICEMNAFALHFYLTFYGVYVIILMCTVTIFTLYTRLREDSFYRMKIAFYTHGCTVNNAETQELNRAFIAGGDEIVASGDADVIIINSCVITSTAEKGTVQLITRLSKKTDAIIVLIGCYADYEKKDMRLLADCNVAVLDKKKQNIVDEVRKLYNKKFNQAEKHGAISEGAAGTCSGFKPTRMLLKVQNGCNNRCSYCIVPHVRGSSVSVPFSEVKESLRSIASQGYKEVLLAGLNLGQYRDNGYTLIDIMQEADNIDEIESIRLSSLEPMNIEDEFIEKLPQIKKLSPHLHISLQSGCDRILSLMNRNYNFEKYLAMLTKIRQSIPNIAVTTDIIVGFPGESEKDFQQSIDNIIRCQFSDIHIFKYSSRKGTTAEHMDKQVTEHQKVQRANVLRGVKLQARYNYYSRFIGTTEKAVIMKELGEDSWSGITAHNFEVVVKSKAKHNDIASVQITGMNDNLESYIGEIIIVKQL